MNLNAKKIYIFLLDLLIAVFSALSFFRDSEGKLNIDYLYFVIGIFILTGRIFFDYRYVTIEERFFQEKVETDLQRSRHNRERLDQIHSRTKLALSNGNLDEYEKLEALKQRFNHE